VGVLLCFLAAATAYDLAERKVPDWLTAAGGIFALAEAAMPLDAIIGGAAMLVFMLGMAALLTVLFGPKALGGGDVKGVAVLGMFLGPTKVLMAVAIGYGLIICWCAIRRRPERLVPLMPFVAAGTGVVLLAAR